MTVFNEVVSRLVSALTIPIIMFAWGIWLAVGNLCGHFYHVHVRRHR